MHSIALWNAPALIKFLEKYKCAAFELQTNQTFNATAFCSNPLANTCPCRSCSFSIVDVRQGNIENRDYVGSAIHKRMHVYHTHRIWCFFRFIFSTNYDEKSKSAIHFNVMESIILTCVLFSKVYSQLNLRICAKTRPFAQTLAVSSFFQCDFF